MIVPFEQNHARKLDDPEIFHPGSFLLNGIYEALILWIVTKEGNKTQ